MKLLAGFGILFGAAAVLVFIKNCWDNFRFYRSMDEYTNREETRWDIAIMACGGVSLAGLVCSALIIAGVVR